MQKILKCSNLIIRCKRQDQRPFKRQDSQVVRRISLNSDCKVVSVEGEGRLGYPRPYKQGL